MQENIDAVLKQYFGFESFRAGQEYLIENILAKRDAVGIMPTGAGKSICFQLPALVLNGITLVISPLISLMRDQVNALLQNGVKAAFINSSLNERQIRIVLDRARQGAYQVIYLAPERLEQADFCRFAQEAPVVLVTVDEAHCISQWGQDFRPSYLKIPQFVASLPRRPVVSAFTATATPAVREDIIQLLQLRDPAVLVSGLDRKNLHFSVAKPADKLRSLLDFLAARKGKSGIVYCSTRNTVEEVCDKLNRSGYAALRYHAGLEDQERQRNQDEFLYDRIQIMVATNAFGMGIDKSNVSYVVHYNMPQNLESYYQEAGRAGRDGEPADCLLLFGNQDVRTNLWLIENSKDMVYPDPQTEQLLKERDRLRLREMTYYCQTKDCLRAHILSYFGEDTADRCDNCGNCQAVFKTVEVTDEAKKILSCVYRLKGRYGAKTVIDVLRGSKRKRLLELGLDRVSTYGVSSLKGPLLMEIVNSLIRDSYLVQTADEYPVLRLGSRASLVLKGNQAVTLKVAEEPQAAGALEKEKTTQFPVDDELYKILKELRLKIARRERVPAFIVFSDSTLRDMCQKMPVNKYELLQVTGIGQVKMERYGEIFISAIKAYIN